MLSDNEARIGLSPDTVKDMIVDAFRRETGVTLDPSRINLSFCGNDDDCAEIVVTLGELAAIARTTNEPVRPDDPPEAQPARRKART
jgi:hypothetical protein